MTYFYTSSAVGACREPEGSDYTNEGHHRGLHQPASAGFVPQSPTLERPGDTPLRNSCYLLMPDDRMRHIRFFQIGDLFLAQCHI